MKTISDIKLNEAIQGLKSKIINPNLLDNWYFGNPVNQRGQTEYTGAGYTIDRWKTNNANQALALDTDGISYEAAAQGQLSEWLEVPFESIAGKTITISAIINGILYSESATVQGNIPTAYTTLAEITVNSALRVRLGYSTYQSRLEFVVAFSGAGSCKLLAAKLEPGEGQTLAHQDGNGNWVLNEIPDYAVEYVKCITSTVDTADDYANCKIITSKGGTLTAPLNYNTGTKTFAPIRIFDYSADGAGMIMQSGGLLIVGGGESACNLYDNLTTGDSPASTGGTENLHLAADKDVYVNTNCQTIANNRSFRFTAAGNLVLPTNTNYTTYKARNIAANTSAMTAGTTALGNGDIYLQYE